MKRALTRAEASRQALDIVAAVWVGVGGFFWLLYAFQTISFFGADLYSVGPLVLILTPHVFTVAALLGPRALRSKRSVIRMVARGGFPVLLLVGSVLGKLANTYFSAHTLFANEFLLMALASVPGMILAMMALSPHRPPPSRKRCLGCGYLTRGLTAEVCPECGETLPDGVSSPS